MANDQAILIGLGAAVGVLLLALALVTGLLLGRSRGRQVVPVAKGDLVPLAPATDTLAPVLQDVRAELRGAIATLDQKVFELQGRVAQDLAAVQARRAAEDRAWESIQRVETALAGLGQSSSTIQRTLQDQVTSALREIGAIKTAQTEERQRWSREDDAFGQLQRLTAVMLGSRGAGEAGERLVYEALGSLPQQWLIPNHRVNGKSVEFAVRLPDGHILPIDSKVVAGEELAALDQVEPDRRRSLERSIREKVADKAAEVRQYLDERSVGFGIAAVPDAAYGVCGPILSRTYQEQHVLLVPYSLLLPFVLMVYEQHRHTEVDMDGERQARLLAAAQAHLERAQQEINGRLGTALTQLQNARGELSSELTEAARALGQIRARPEAGPD